MSTWDGDSRGSSDFSSSSTFGGTCPNDSWNLQRNKKEICLCPMSAISLAPGDGENLCVC